MKGELIIKIEQSELPEDEQEARLLKAFEMLLCPPDKNYEQRDK